MTAPHPAKFNDAILAAIAATLRAHNITKNDLILDPFAGTGRIHRLRPEFTTIGIEIEREWAEESPYTFVGDATRLPSGWSGSFQAWVSSPTYGNRMADHHEAKDGSKRHTYRHMLGRPLHPLNTGQFGFHSESYKMLHRRAYAEAYRVLAGDPRRGILICNVKNFYRQYELVDIVSWHQGAIERAGFQYLYTKQVDSPGMLHGANRQRVGQEAILVFRRKVIVTRKEAQDEAKAA